MKNDKALKNLSVLKCAVGWAAAACFIVKAVIFCEENTARWWILNAVYFLPFLAMMILGSLRGKINPRRELQLVIASAVPGMLLSAVMFDGYTMMAFITQGFEDYCTWILLIAAFVFAMLAYFAGVISKYMCTVPLTLPFGTLLIDVIINAVYGDEYYVVFETIAYFLYIVYLIFIIPFFNSENQFEAKVINRFWGIDDGNEDDKFSFDIIVDDITLGSISTDNYQAARTAQRFYYAVKKDDMATLDELGISGREAVACVFEAWRAYESDFWHGAEETLFFNLCKVMTSDETTNDEFNDNFYFFKECVQREKNLFGEADVRLSAEEPYCILSNLYDDPFDFDTFKVKSIEGIIQGLKFKDAKKQAQVFEMSGKDAKKAGRHHNFWKLTGNLYYRGTPLKRDSKDYQDILTIAYSCRYDQSEKFKKALLDSGLKTLTHSIGKNSMWSTLLTVDDYIDRLNFLKKIAFSEKYGLLNSEDGEAPGDEKPESEE